MNARDTNGQTPLHLVTLRGHLKAVQALLEHRAGVNTVDNNGKTPLALLDKDLKMVRSRRGLLNQIDYQAVEALLLQYGATGPVLTPKTGFRTGVLSQDSEIGEDARPGRRWPRPRGQQFGRTDMYQWKTI